MITEISGSYEFAEVTCTQKLMSPSCSCRIRRQCTATAHVLWNYPRSKHRSPADSGGKVGHQLPRVRKCDKNVVRYRTALTIRRYHCQPMKNRPATVCRYLAVALSCRSKCSTILAHGRLWLQLCACQRQRSVLWTYSANENTEITCDVPPGQPHHHQLSSTFPYYFLLILICELRSTVQFSKVTVFCEDNNEQKGTC